MERSEVRAMERSETVAVVAWLKRAKGRGWRGCEGRWCRGRLVDLGIVRGSPNDGVDRGQCGGGVCSRFEPRSVGTKRSLGGRFWLFGGEFFGRGRCVVRVVFVGWGSLVGTIGGGFGLGEVRRVANVAMIA